MISSTPRTVEGMKFAVFGVANEHSLALRIAESLVRHGGEVAYSYFPAAERMVNRALNKSFGDDPSRLVMPCDVNHDDDLDAFYARLFSEWGTLDGVVHAVAYADRADLHGNILETSREGFKVAMESSAFSLLALTKRAVPLMRNGGSIVALSFIGSQLAVPKYKVMGAAKAALETLVLYLAAELGPQNIRVNGVRSGPVRTLSAMGLSGFKQLLEEFPSAHSMMRRQTDPEAVGDAGLFLLSPLARDITGHWLDVDTGASKLGTSNPPEKA